MRYNYVNYIGYQMRLTCNYHLIDKLNPSYVLCNPKSKGHRSDENLGFVASGTRLLNIV